MPGVASSSQPVKCSYSSGFDTHRSLLHRPGDQFDYRSCTFQSGKTALRIHLKNYYLLTGITNYAVLLAVLRLAALVAGIPGRASSRGELRESTITPLLVQVFQTPSLSISQRMDLAAQCLPGKILECHGQQRPTP